MSSRTNDRGKSAYVAMSPRTLLEPLDRGALDGHVVEGLGLGLQARRDSSSFACEGYVGSRCAKQASQVPVLREDLLEEEHRQVDHQDRRDQWEVSCIE
jgi:hypothetical protein